MTSGKTEPLSPWNRACLALELLSVEPRLGGLWLRARSGPVRDKWLSLLPCPARKIHPTISDEQLFGGVDISATLSTGRLTQTEGLLQTSDWLLLTMAERAPSGLAARLAHAVDDGTVAIALDESADAQEGLPTALADRLAFHVDLDGLRLGETNKPAWRSATGEAAVTSEALTQIAEASGAFGVYSTRTLRQTALTAETLARLSKRDTVSEGDITRALELVIAPRATQLPQAPQEPSEPPAPPDEAPAQSETDGSEPEIPQELLLEAIKAALPPDLLGRLAAAKTKRQSAFSGGTGSKLQGNRRGRPLPSRPGRLGSGARLDLVATLRAAAPWQPLRKKLTKTMVPAGTRLTIRPSDIRVKRFEDRSDRLLIFTVDASGSAALSRLAEAKGAIELLLAEAYARRDHVALVSFRGTQAEILLPPTRSLVQTKRRLAALPGGGGTPLAAGLRAATELGLQAQSRGMTPTVTLLTDGRANIALDGAASRPQAAEDAQAMARHIPALGLEALVIDTGKRPERSLEALSATMQAPYIPLPRADAQRLSQAVSGALS